MDLATAMSIVQAILAVIQTSHQIKLFFSLFGYKSELENLQSTLNIINAVLCDAEAKHDALSQQEKQHVEELEDAVYDADDLLDEFFTLVQQKQLFEDDDDKFSYKVKSYFSRFKPSAFKLSRKVKKVQRKLDAIATKSSQFSFKVVYQPDKFRKEESCSRVFADDIIGRETDVEKILGMLLDSNVDRDISCLTIVGIGGMGKTALAQLVYNHERVKSAFPTRLWACVSDENTSHLDTEATLRKILASATGCKDDNCTLDRVQNQLREHLNQKKYLLVLDDVWNENRDDAMKLAGYLKGGVKGSWILVTTRSRETAGVIANGPMYKLHGLKAEDSWRLFQRVAFGTERPDPSTFYGDLVAVGREIVRRCPSAPIAIRAVGSLLYGQPRSKWLLFQENGLANIGESEHEIKPIMKLSYHHLKPPLKSCFRYCAIFPKDHKIMKETLISLWMAQGYIIPEKGEDLADVAEQYFLILKRRGFFQDVERDSYGEIKSCKIHDLMLDIAQDAAANEVYLASGKIIKVGGKVRHLSLMGVRNEFPTSFRKQNNIRTCLLPSQPNVSLDELVEKCTRLRTLDLSEVGIPSLPDSIGNLLHLRYLNLSDNRELKVLPPSITKLRNLQTLTLSWCIELRELPNDVDKLVNLSSLDISLCDKLTYMPSGLGTLTRLHTLGDFMVGRSSSSWKQFIDELETLKPLNNLKGILTMHLCVPGCFEKDGNWGGAYLRSKVHLIGVKFKFTDGEWKRSSGNEEAVLKQLQPHSNLRQLLVEDFRGVRMPKWLRETDLPNLVYLTIQRCKNLRCLPSMGGLPHLKHLRLFELPKVEFVDIDNPVAPGSSGEASSYFPCLEILFLGDMPKLKGWWGRSGSELVHNKAHPCLPQLKQFSLVKCPKMRCIPLCRHLEELRIEPSDSLELELVEDPRHRITYSSCLPSSMSSHPKFHPIPMKLTITDLNWLKSMPREYLLCLTEMVIQDEKGVESLVEVIDGRNLSSLRSLEIRRCRKLKSICEWIEHLSALERLCIRDCPELLKNSEKEQTYRRMAYHGINFLPF